MRNATRLLDHFFGKLVGQVVLADDNLDVDSEIVGIAKHLNYAAHGFIAIFWKFENLDIHDHAVEIFD